MLAFLAHSFLGVLPTQSNLLRAMFSLPGMIVNITYVVFIVATTVLFIRIKRGRTLARTFEVFALVIFLSSIFVLIFATGDIKVSKGNIRTGHPIKRIILIVVDTLRADALSSYGGQRISTPNIDQFASEGILFKKAFSPSPWTKPSVASILTGLPPSVHMTKDLSSVIPDALPTLAEYMQDSGYLTHAIVTNVILREQCFQQGFMTYNSFPKREDFTPCGKVLSWFFPKRFSGTASTAELTQLAIDWVESNADKDFFLWLHYYDPHLPYSPPEKYLIGMEAPPGMQRSFESSGNVRSGHQKFTYEQREWLRTLYESEIRYVDDSIGLLLNHLRKLDMYDDTLIILTSDHGEEFWEHGGFEHGHTLYNELLWIPLIIKPVDTSTKGNIEQPVSIESIPSTILELCKIESEQSYMLRNSLVPIWTGQVDTSDIDPIVSDSVLYYEEKESVIFNEQKYIRFLVTDREEFYELDNDPSEKSNIAYMSETKIKKAEMLLDEHYQVSETLKKHYSLGEGKKKELDADTLQKLKGLGYVR
jgi:arylsulfatase A-like enzyme